MLEDIYESPPLPLMINLVGIRRIWQALGWRTSSYFLTHLFFILFTFFTIFFCLFLFLNIYKLSFIFLFIIFIFFHLFIIFLFMAFIFLLFYTNLLITNYFPTSGEDCITMLPWVRLSVS